MNKQFLIIAIIAAIAIYLLGLFTCNGYYKNKFQCPTIKSDTVVKYLPSDTGKTHSNIPIGKEDTTWIRFPITEVDSFISFAHDTLTISDTTKIKELQKKYTELLNSFYSTHSYTDTTHFKNGIVKVQSIVTRNSLMNQRVILDSAFQTQITKTPPPISLKEKTQLWLGIDLYGNKHDYLSGAGISATLKFPHIAVNAGTYFDQYNNINYRAGISWLIKLKK